MNQLYFSNAILVFGFLCFEKDSIFENTVGQEARKAVNLALNNTVISKLHENKKRKNRLFTRRKITQEKRNVDVFIKHLNMVDGQIFETTSLLLFVDYVLDRCLQTRPCGWGVAGPYT